MRTTADYIALLRENKDVFYACAYGSFAGIYMRPDSTVDNKLRELGCLIKAAETVKVEINREWDEVYSALQEEDI